MPGQYSIRCRSRPHPESSGTQTAPPRRFLCVRCRAPVLVCSHCDRGQIYCAGGCAQEARACAQRAAGQRYQESFRGRLKHAARAAHHRARQKIVTHQGSPREPRDDVVRLDAATAANKPANRVALSCDPKLPILVPGAATGADVAVRCWSASGSCVAAGEARAEAGNGENTMAIPPDLEAQILRYHLVEKWRVGTIARQLRVHHETVVRVLSQPGLPKHGSPARRSQIEPYLPFIRATLEKFPE